MNWGWRITIVYLAFAAGILTLVFKAKGSKVDLVAKDYYNQELAFGARIEATNNASALSSGFTATLVADGIEIFLPQECESSPVDGTITLYCPSDASQDRTLDLVSGSRAQFVNTSGLKAGLYIVKVNWKMNGKSYFSEKSISI
jgi:nitrogen fixation protein FixH